MKKSKKQVKNFKSAKLVQYKGGGYDGCFWEWNFALLVDGVFHDVISSGRRAIKDKTILLAYIKADESIYCYNLNKKSDIIKFTKENNETIQGEVISEVNRILNSNIMFFECTYCNEDIFTKNDRPHDADYPQFFHDPNAYHGNGGIGIVFSTILCENCYCNTCEICGSIFAPDDENFAIETSNGYKLGVCECCKKDAESHKWNPYTDLTPISYVRKCQGF